jgi:hypothetical protein
MPGLSVRSSLWGLATFVLCAGCGKDNGPELAAVSGSVTLDGKPLPHVNLQFVPEKEGGSPSYGGTDANGRYKLMFSQGRAGAMPGKHRVEITAREAEDGDDGQSKAAGEAVKIPPKYLQPGALTAEVKPKSNLINFPLETK